MGEKKRENCILEQITFAYLALLCSAFLIFPGFSGYAHITINKFVLYAALTVAYLACCLIFLAKQHCFADFRFSWSERFVILYWLASLVSAILSDYPDIAFWGSSRMEGFAAITLYCFSFLMISHFGYASKRLLLIFCCGMCLNCLLSAAQFFGLTPLQLYPDGMNYYDGNQRYYGEYFGTLGNADLQSAVLCLAIPVFAVSSCKQKGIIRWFLFAALLLSLGVLLYSRVAGGVFGILVCAVITIPVSVRNHQKQKVVALTIAALCVLGLILICFLNPHLSGTFFELSELLHGRVEDYFGSGRIFIWRNVLDLVREKPLFGGGADTLGARISVCFERYDETLGITRRTSIDAAHNEYLNILVNQGAAALAFYLSALFVSAAQWIKRAKYGDSILICGCAVLGYCAQAFFGLSSPITTPFFWCAFGLLQSSFRQSDTIFR